MLQCFRAFGLMAIIVSAVACGDEYDPTSPDPDEPTFQPVVIDGVGPELILSGADSIALHVAEKR